MEVEAMQQAQIDVHSRLIMFEFAEFGSLNSIFKKWCEPVMTADDPRKADLPFLRPSFWAFLIIGKISTLKIISTTTNSVLNILRPS